MVLVIGIPAVIGSLLGGFFADDVKAWILLGLIASLSAISSVISFSQWLRALRKPSQPEDLNTSFSPIATRDGVSLNQKKQMLYGSLGFAIGVLGGAAGLILAVLRFPILINVLRMDPRTAAGSNNTIGVLAGISGFAGHAINMNFDIAVLAVMGMTGMAGSFIGAKQTGRISATTMRLMVAVLLAATTPIVVVRMFAEYPN